MKGSCEIILKNAATGKVEQRVKHHNMLTNALTNILQPPAKFVAGKGGNFSYWYQKMLPIYSGALGGILLFEEPLTEDADNIIPDFSHCIGHAGGLYAGDNTYRGTLNTTESGPVTNGYKSVWDFSTSQANGTISAVALTSRFGGECGIANSIVDPYTNLFDDLKSYSTYSYNDENRLYPGFGYDSHYSADFDYSWNFAGEFSQGVLTFFRKDDTSIDVANVPWSDTLSVTDILNYESFSPSYTTYTSAYDFYYFIQSNAKDKCVLLEYTDAKYDTDFYYAEITADGVKNEKQFTTPSGSYSRYYDHVNLCFEFNGYIYGMAGNQSGNFTQMYRIKVSDGSSEIIDLPAQVDTLEKVVELDDKVILKLNDSVYLFDGTNFTEINVPLYNSEDSDYTCAVYSSNYLPKPYYYYYRSSRLVPVVFNPYLGTINNLSEPVTKTATQTMKIIYTLTNEE